MAKFTDTQLKDLMEQGLNARQIAEQINQSYSNTSWRINRIKKMVATPAPAVAVAIPQAPSSVEQIQAGQDAFISSMAPQQETPEVEQPISRNANSYMESTVTRNMAHFIPEAPKQYIRRDVDHQIEFWASINPETNRPYGNPLLIGEAGTGKTFTPQCYAAKHNLPYLNVSLDNDSCLSELLGQPSARDGSTYWIEGLLVKMIQQPCVVQMDEANVAIAGKLFMLHEMLQNRILFVKDAPPEKSIVKIHPECRIFLSMNPPTSKYSGTNRLNPALAERCVHIEMPAFTTEQMFSNITSGNEALDAQLRKFYDEASDCIKAQKMRATISIRHITNIANAVRAGFTVGCAIRNAFVNSALCTASTIERDVLLNIAVLTFGATTMQGKAESEVL